MSLDLLPGCGPTGHQSLHIEEVAAVRSETRKAMTPSQVSSTFNDVFESRVSATQATLNLESYL